jgi:hypothetical protein
LPLPSEELLLLPSSVSTMVELSSCVVFAGG